MYYFWNIHCSEAYNAINYGADGLKIFPASSLNMMDLKQLVLPQNLKHDKNKSFRNG